LGLFACIAGKCGLECLAHAFYFEPNLLESSNKFVRIPQQTPSKMELESEHLVILHNQFVPIVYPDHFLAYKGCYFEHRRTVLNWLTSLCKPHVWDLSLESLFTAVNLLDRFQSRANLAADRLLLLGTVALIVAGKYCAVRVSKKKWIVDAQSITGFAYTLAEIQGLELEMLQCVPGQIKMPNTMTFLDLTLPADADMQVRCLTCYLAELTLYEQVFLSYPPLHICAVCVMLARRLLGMQISAEEIMPANEDTQGPACSKSDLQALYALVQCTHRTACAVILVDELDLSNSIEPIDSNGPMQEADDSTGHQVIRKYHLDVFCNVAGIKPLAFD